MAVVGVDVSSLVDEAAAEEEGVSLFCEEGRWVSHDMRDVGEPLQLSSTGSSTIRGVLGRRGRDGERRRNE